MRGSVALAFLALGACTSFDAMKDNWPKLKGRPIEEAVRRFGYPQQEQTILGDKVYTWHTTRPYVATVPTPATTVLPGGGSVTTYGSSSAGVTLQCEVKIATDPAGKIKTMQYDGSNAACMPFAEAMRRD